MSFYCIILPFRILWKPSLLYPSFLLKQFTYGPQERSSKDSKKRRYQGVAYKQSRHYGSDTQYEEYPPILSAGIIFSLYYYGMEYPYYQKGTYCYYDSCKIHISKVIVS